MVYIARHLRAATSVCTESLVTLGGVYVVVAVSSQSEQDHICQAMGGIPAVLHTYRLGASVLSLFTFELFRWTNSCREEHREDSKYKQLGRDAAEFTHACLVNSFAEMTMSPGDEQPENVWDVKYKPFYRNLHLAETANEVVQPRSQMYIYSRRYRVP